MKKRWLIFGLTAMLSLGCLFACDSGNGDDNGDGTGTEQGDSVNFAVLEGTYALETLREGEDEYNVGDTYQGGVLTADTIIVCLSQDGTAIVSGFGETLEGTWTKTDNTVSVIAGGTTNVFTWENGRLTCDVGDGYGWTVKKISNAVNPDGVGDNDNNQGGNGSQGGEIINAEIVGTYKFEQMIVKGTTYEVGQSYKGTLLTANYIVMAFEENGTAYVAMVGEENLTGTWTLNGNEIQIASNGYVETFAWENGKIVSYSEPYATLGKVSNTVNPEDFGFKGEQGGNDNTGDTTTPEEDVVDISVLEGTYHFEQLEYGGTTYKAGESFYDTALTENFLVVALEKDGTAYVRSSGDESKGTWQWDEDRILVDSNNEEMYYRWKDGKLVSTKAPIMTVGKTSNKVIPEDFGFKAETGTDSGNTDSGTTEGGNTGSGTDSGNTDSGTGEEGIVQAKIVGVYNFYRLDMYEGETYYVGDYFSNMNRLTEKYYYYELKADGSAIVIWQDGGFDGCTWSWDGEYVSIKLESGYELAKMTFDGEYLYEVQDFSYKVWIKKTA